MSSEESPTTEEQFATWLATCEDALAAGLPPPLPDEADLPPGVRLQMEKALAGLRLLHQLRSRPGPEETPPRSPPKVESDSSPQSELPWTQLGHFELRRELGRSGFGLPKRVGPRNSRLCGRPVETNQLALGTLLS
jgi:hypothetical protein